jgi:hypothetical protein
VASHPLDERSPRPGVSRAGHRAAVAALAALSIVLIAPLATAPIQGVVLAAVAQESPADAPVASAAPIVAAPSPAR